MGHEAIIPPVAGPSFGLSQVYVCLGLVVGLSLDPYPASSQWILPIPRVSFAFPEPSLMRHLLDTYFDIHNIILPTLHRPTFERSLADKLHERNESFGAVVILTCAIACRYSDDPRVTHPITTSTSNTGWTLFNQVDRQRRARLFGHQLYDAQVYAVRSLTLFGDVCSWDGLKASRLLPGRVLSSTGSVGDRRYRPTGNAGGWSPQARTHRKADSGERALEAMFLGTCHTGPFV